MKKSIDKSIKNEFFRKIAMRILFVLMCFFGCFTNLKAAAKDEWFKIMWNESGYEWESDLPVQSVQYQTLETADSSVEEDKWNDVNLGTSFSLDTDKKLYFKVTFKDDNVLSENDVCLFYKGNANDVEKNSKAKLYSKNNSNNKLENACFYFEPGAIIGTDNSESNPYELHVLPKSYSFSTGSFKNSSDNPSFSAYDVLDIKYGIDGQEPDKPFPSVVMNGAGSSSANGSYDGVLLFDKPTTIKLQITGKNKFNTKDLKYFFKDNSSEVKQWNDAENEFTGEGYEIKSADVKLYFESIPVEITMDPLNEYTLIFDKVNFGYNFNGGSIYTTIPKGDGKPYWSCSSEVGKTIYIKAEKAAGVSDYKISGIQYKFNDNGTKTWDEDGVISFVLIGDTNLKLSHEDELKLTPQYKTEDQELDNDLLYKVIDLQYKIGSDEGQESWATDSTNNTYDSLNIYKGSKITITVTQKKGTEDEYDITGLACTLSNGEESITLNVTSSGESIELDSFSMDSNKTLTFSGIKKKFTLHLTYHNENNTSGNTEDLEHLLYTVAQISYKEVDNDSEFKEWEKAQDSAKYTDKVFKEGTEIKIVVKNKKGYDISGLKYWIYNTGGTASGSGTSPQDSGDTKEITMEIGADQTLAFGGIQNRDVTLNFVPTGLDGNAKPEEVLEVYKDSLTQSSLSHGIKANQKCKFTMKFLNCDSSMKTDDFGNSNIKVFDYNDVDITNDFVFNFSDDGNGWSDSDDDGSFSFSFDVTAQTDLSKVEFRISGIKKKFKLEFECTHTDGTKTLYNAVEIKYAIDEKGTENWDSSNDYLMVNENSKITITVTQKKGTEDEYDITGLACTLSNGEESITLNVTSSGESIELDSFSMDSDKTLTFSGIKKKFTLHLTYHNENNTSGNTEDLERLLYTVAQISYKEVDNNSEFKEWEKAQDAEKYTDKVFKEGTEIKIVVKNKKGYDISGLKYWIYNTGGTASGSGTSPQDSGDTKEITMEIGADQTLAFGGIQNRDVTLNFVPTGLDGNAKPEEVLKIYKDNLESSNYSYVIKANQKCKFTMKFLNCDSSMKTDDFGNSNIRVFDDNEVDVTNDFVFNFSDDGNGWSDSDDDGSFSFSFDVTAQTDLSKVEFRISGIVLKRINITFVQDEDHLIDVYKNNNGTFGEKYNWSGGKFVISYPGYPESPEYGGSFEFILKPIEGGSWQADLKSLEGQALIDKLISVSDEELKKKISVETILSSEDVGDIIAYKITIGDIKNEFTVTLQKGVVKFNAINILFKSINLPNDGKHNDINVSQGDSEVLYPDRGNDKYVLKAKVFPRDSTEPINITLPSIENFKFVVTEEGDFVFKDINDKDSYIEGTLTGDQSGQSISFKLDETCRKKLESGDVDIVCNCLIPNEKKISFALNNGVTAVVSDSQDGELKISGEGVPSTSTVSDDSHYVLAKYGRWISINYTLKEGSILDNPEEQIVVYAVTKNSDGSDKLETLGYDTYWNITSTAAGKSEIVFNNILQYDLKVAFSCDVDNIPIEFKNIEGLNYYFVNIENNMVNESQPFVIKDEETKEKETIKGIVTVPIGSDYYFAVGADAGYDMDSLKITQNGNEPEEIVPATQQTEDDETGQDTYAFVEYEFKDPQKAPEGYKFYRLITVKSNVTISGTISKKKLNVEFKGTASVDGTGEYAIVEYKRDNVAIGGNSLDVLYGNAAVFTVSLPEDRYNQSDFKVKVRNKGQSESEGIDVIKYQNEYRILDIEEDKEVYVTNVTVNKYVINFVANDKSEYLIDDKLFSGTQTKEHGASVEFKVRAKEGYKLDSDVVVNYLGKVSSALKPTHSTGSGEDVVYTFKINNIQENGTIMVENVSSVTYKITFKNVPGATYLNDRNLVISGEVTVDYGKNFEFAVSVDDSYDDSASGMFIILNDGKTELSAQKLSSGRYMIPNITEDVEVKVGNIRKNTYTVTLRNEDGIDYYNPNDKIITGDNTVEHGGSLSFRVYLYPAYSDSKITVMLGNDKMLPDSSGYYNISGIVENKIVTVIGIHANAEVELVNTINNLPPTINDLNDVNSVIETSKWYNSLSDDQKANVSNIDILKSLQQQAGEVLHRSNDVTISGPEWYVKLIVIPISSDMDVCSRIYKKLNSEYILCLYNIYLWDTLNDVKYIPGEGEMYTVTMPKPKLTNFVNPTGVHENSNTGKISFMDLLFDGDMVSFQTDSFSPMGIVARHDATGVSSLFDAAGVNLDWINDYVLGSNSKVSSDSKSSNGQLINNDDEEDDDVQGNDENVGNINDKFRSINNRVTPQGSALRLTLVLLILILIAISIWIIYKKHKEYNKNK